MTLPAALPKPSSSLQLKPQNLLALKESEHAQSQLDALLLGCFTVQRIYGKEPGSLTAVNQVFHNVLGHLPGEQVVLAFRLWMQRSQEFPTPADIAGLVRRKGKPPLKESDVIAIRKKDGEDRTAAEWATLREWDEQQAETFPEFTDHAKDESMQQENIRLRNELTAKQMENKRLAQLLSEARQAKGLEPPSPTIMDKVSRTVEEMRRTGATEADIEQFQRQYA
jgi:hypothetical protein